jgi:2-hydroxychromene-2-carboxylate isomerase
MRKRIIYITGPRSPFSYLGHARLVDIARARGAAIDLKIPDFDRIRGSGNGLLFPPKSPQKTAYVAADLTRWSAHLGVPINLVPRYRPVDKHPPSRFVIATLLHHGTDNALQVLHAVLRGLWAEDRNIADPDTLAAMAGQLGLDGARLLALSEGEAVDRQYTAFTEEAMAAQVFGVPWYIVDGDSYWGRTG